MKIFCNIDVLNFLVAKSENSRAIFKTILILIQERIENIERFEGTTWQTKKFFDTKCTFKSGREKKG